MSLENGMELKSVFKTAFWIDLRLIKTCRDSKISMYTYAYVHTNTHPPRAGI